LVEENQVSKYPWAVATPAACILSLVKSGIGNNKRSLDIDLIQAPSKPHTRPGKTLKSEECMKRADCIRLSF
jgi:hypothetical protein